MTSVGSWSGLRKAVRAQLAPSVRNRVDIFVTRYRHAHDGDGRWAIRVDGREVAGVGDIVARAERFEYDHIAREPEGSASQSGFRWAAASGRQQHGGFVRSLRSLLALPIETALESNDLVIRALALLDRRLGKRRLRSLCLAPNASELERALLRVRLESEGITPQPQALAMPGELAAAPDGTRGGARLDAVVVRGRW